MTDRRNRLAGVVEFGDDALQRRALQILAHAWGVTSRQQQSAKVFRAGLPMAQRRAKCRIVHKFSVSGARIAIGAQHQADQLEPLQPGNAAPEIQADARRHDRIGAGGCTVRSGEEDVVSGIAQDAPAHRDFRRIEVGARQRHQYSHARVSSSGGPSRRRRCIQATSCHAPNLRPIDLKTPIGSKPRLRCRAMLASFGSVAPANALQ